MEQQPPVIQNKKLLVISLVLAAMVVVIYNVHISHVRSSARPEIIKCMQYTHDMARGAKIEEKDVSVVELEKQVATRVQNIVQYSEANYNTIIGSVMNQDAYKGNWVLWTHTMGSEQNSPAGNIEPGMVVMALTIDPRMSPGDVLRPGGKVSLMGMFSVRGAQPRAYYIIDDLKVHNVGGRGPRDTGRYSAGPVNEGISSYRSITVEVAREVAAELANVLSHAQGGVWAVVSNPLDRQPNSRRINAELNELKSRSAAAEQQPIEE